MENWLDNEFESSSMTTPEFANFNMQVKKHIKKITKNEFELTSWSRGHFEFSGFLKSKENGKYIYFSASDVRHFKNAWYNNLLIRTAENDKDYTGGRNNNCKLNDLPKKALSLI